MPVATVHRQITAQDRITYGTEENIRGRILDVGTQKWPAGSALVGIFSADGTQTAAAGNHPLPEYKYVLKGELKVSIDGTDYTLLPGDLLSVEKGAFIAWHPSAYEVLLFTQREQAYPPARL